MNSTTANAAPQVRVMIVDDSALMRKLLTQALTRDPGIIIVDTAMDGQFALDHLARIRPDVVLMDIDMPRLDGLSTLDRIVADHKLPVVMCSTRTAAGAEATIDALARGAVDFVEKPSLQALTSGTAAAEIIAVVRAAAGARIRVPTQRRPQPSSSAVQPASQSAPQSQNSTPRKIAPILSTADILSAQASMPKSSGRAISGIAQAARRILPEIVAIGISTGGPPALEQVLSQIPANFSLPIVIVQHMPAGFTTMLATHLDRVSGLTVREAREGEAARPGTALIAPGGCHLRVRRTATGYVVTIDAKTPPQSGHRPSVDVLFESVVQTARGRAVAVLMTGMGNDGADGLGRLAAAGAVTIAQSPDSCICHGMPKSAIDRGYASAVVTLDEIASAITACGASNAAPNSTS